MSQTLLLVLGVMNKTVRIPASILSFYSGEGDVTNKFSGSEITLRKNKEGRSGSGMMKKIFLCSLVRKGPMRLGHRETTKKKRHVKKRRKGCPGRRHSSYKCPGAAVGLM